MMTAVVQEKPTIVATRPLIPPSVLLIGKKRAVEYIPPALFRLNTTGELVIKATGSLSIVTAVDVAEMTKRDIPNAVTKSITIGTNELRIATGELKRMSCIEIHLLRNSPVVAVLPPAPVAPVPAVIEIPAPVVEAPAPIVEAPVAETQAPVAEVPAPAKKKRATTRKKAATTAKKATTRKKKPAA